MLLIKIPIVIIIINGSYTMIIAANHNLLFSPAALAKVDDGARIEALADGPVFVNGRPR